MVHKVCGLSRTADPTLFYEIRLQYEMENFAVVAVVFDRRFFILRLISIKYPTTIARGVKTTLIILSDENITFSTGIVLVISTCMIHH